MSIDEATPQDWNRLRDRYPAIERTGKDIQPDIQPDTVDMVDAPKHYNHGHVECIEAIKESMSPMAFKGYLKGNCIKYLWRYDYKGKQVEDLRKAGWYLKKLTERVGIENERGKRNG